LENENVYLRREVKARSSPGKMVYKSQAMVAGAGQGAAGCGDRRNGELSGETERAKRCWRPPFTNGARGPDRAMVRVNCGAIRRR